MIPRFRHLVSRRRLGEITGGREQLANYLLRRATAEESAQITERLFGEEEFAEQLEDVERDLLGAYGRGELSAKDRAAVESCLITSETQREKLRFATAFAQRGRRAEPVAARYWLAAAAALVVIAGAGAVFWQNRQLRLEIASLRASEARVADAAAVSFLIAPAERASVEEILKIGAGATLVKLNFSLGSAAAETVDVQIRKSGGGVVVEQRALKTVNVSGAFYVSVWLPASALEPGAYSAAVTQGQQELDYAFRVTSYAPVAR